MCGTSFFAKSDHRLTGILPDAVKKKKQQKLDERVSPYQQQASKSRASTVLSSGDGQQLKKTTLGG